MMLRKLYRPVPPKHYTLYRYFFPRRNAKEQGSSVLPERNPARTLFDEEYRSVPELLEPHFVKKAGNVKHVGHRSDLASTTVFLYRCILPESVRRSSRNTI